MTEIVLSKKTKEALNQYLSENQPAELVNAYLCYLENAFHLEPVACPKERKIYQSEKDAIQILEAQDKIWRETEIKIGFSPQSVNSETKKIYICPFSGKVFGDNTHPNPQDAIYDWVSKCPENTERAGGLKVKRFFVSDDPEVVQSYLAKEKPKTPIKKVVYSSVLSGKLYNSKDSVIRDFVEHYLTPITLIEVQNQNRFEIEEHFMDFIQQHVTEEKIAAFVEALAEHEEFLPFVGMWIE